MAHEEDSITPVVEEINGKEKASKQTLYYSTLIDMNDVPIQNQKVEVVSQQENGTE